MSKKTNDKRNRKTEKPEKHSGTSKKTKDKNHHRSEIYRLSDEAYGDKGEQNLRHKPDRDDELDDI